MLPLDILYALVDIAELGVINSLARSCRTLAKYVRDNADQLATARCKYTWVAGLSSAEELPNGVRHGTATFRVYGDTREQCVKVAGEYHLGTLTHWMLTVDGCDIWGHASSNYTVRCYDRTCMATTCMIYAWVGNDNLSAAANGREVELGYNVINAPIMPPLVGFLIDGKMCVDVVTSWMDKVVATRQWDIDTPGPIAISMYNESIDKINKYFGMSLRAHM